MILKLEILDLERKEIVLYIYVVKTKMLISRAVTAQLICAFVFTYAKSMFSPMPFPENTDSINI